MVKVDGWGFRAIPYDQLDWIKAKRKEFIMLNVTTAVPVLIAAFVAALIVEKKDFTGEHAA